MKVLFKLAAPEMNEINQCLPYLAWKPYSPDSKLVEPALAIAWGRLIQLLKVKKISFL